MTEGKIRALAREILTKHGWLVWCPPKARYQETDIFSFADAICAKDKRTRLIQWTTKSNKSARTKKIQAVLLTNNLELTCELWCVDPKTKLFSCFVVSRDGCTGSNNLQVLI